ncbi:Crp/Fnr family transcriptional regulator [Sphingomonas arantia]|uniref:Crp/Fnr family transcriptional regulator n=1 Tax=Sphingomonas arantia TaxID=1460676 RepID=A0ABW4TR65_9SPHN
MTPQAAALRLFVKRLASRSCLTNDEVSGLLELGGHLKRYAAHTDFVRVGDLIDHSCLIVDGLVGRFGQNGDGLRQISGLYITGDMADLPSVVSPRAGWGIGALTTTTILQIPHADVRRLAGRHPGVAEALWRDCVVDGSIFSEWVVNVGRRNALSRIAHLFCEMAIRCEQAGIGSRTSFPLPITQWDLGDATGLTSVHVNRTLKELRTASVADLRSGVVTVYDWDKLVSVGDFDPAFLLLDSPAPRITDAA